VSAALPAARTFAVAPAAVWRLLWLWVPLLGCAALIVVGTLQSDQRTTHELALTVPFLALLLAVLTWAFFRRRITLQGRRHGRVLPQAGAGAGDDAGQGAGGGPGRT